MLRPYVDILTVPGTRGFTTAGALARLPISMLGIGVVLLIEGSTGSYGAAGAVAGVVGLTSAASSPMVSRAVDRFGQARVMLPVILVHLVAVAALVTCAEQDAPIWTVFLAAVVTGGSFGSIGSLVRARWSYVLNGRERAEQRLQTAYALESVIDEVVFIAGPLLVTLLATRLSPAYGLAAAAAAKAVGGAWLLLQRRSEPPPAGAAAHHRGSGVMRSPGMIVLTSVMVCLGAIFGSVEVLTVAFAEEQGHLGRSGWVLASFALGSMLAGIGYGAVHWRSPARRRFRIGVLLLATGVGTTLLAGDLATLAITVFVAGFGIAPSLISGNALIQDLVPSARLTEGLTWSVSGIGIGTSMGSALAGRTVDAVGAERGFLVPVGAGVLAAVLTLSFSHWLRPSAAPDSPAPDSPAPDGRAPDGTCPGGAEPGGAEPGGADATPRPAKGRGEPVRGPRAQEV